MTWATAISWSFPDRYAGIRLPATSRSYKRELPIDILEFFLPDPAARLGRITRQHSMPRVPMDTDMNNYDLEHVCTGHADVG